MAILGSFAAFMLLASPILAVPVESIALPHILARQGFGSCRNQSCEVATVAGSTGATVYPYSTYPIGDTQAGDCCIIRYFPAVKNEIYNVRPGLQAYCQANGGDAPLDANPPGVNSITASNKRSVDSLAARDIIEAQRSPRVAATTQPATEGLGRRHEKRQSSSIKCTPNILIFVKGTLEPGATGVTVGPILSASLNSSLWTTVGVNYDNSFDNDLCLGLPGGISARQVLAQQAAACPSSNIAMSGYSQGAMVVRNALARAPASNVARVTNVVTFGDPFDGANIGQYCGPVHVFCANGDGVCNGQDDIGLAHLSYFANISQAAQILMASQKTSL